MSAGKLLSEELLEFLRTGWHQDREDEWVSPRYYDEKEALDKLGLQGGLASKLQSLESEVQRLTEENAEWERWNTRCRQTKEEWGKQLTVAESRLAQARDIITFYESHMGNKESIIKQIKAALGDDGK